MKKILIVLGCIVLIPYLIITLFIKDDTVHFHFVSNMSVRVKRVAKDEIIEVPLEEYVVGVLSGEMPTSFELEALKAQAVAARSYVLKKMEQNRKKEYDVVDTVSNQVYLDYDELKVKWGIDYDNKISKIKQAVVETTGEYLTYNNQVIEAFFFSTSSGMTENCDEVFSESLPYLVSVDSHYDSISPSFEVNREFPLSTFYQLLNLPYQEKLEISITKTTSTGRVKELTINGNKFTGSEVYSKLSLKSTFFEIKQDNQVVKITTKGYGHGVGMSQYGANGMAKEGYNYDEILKHYYVGTTISKI